MKIYNYRPDTKVFTVESDAPIDPANKTSFFIPAHSTAIKPPTAVSPEFAFFDGSRWNVKYDFTGKELFDKTDGRGVANTLLIGDDLPVGLTLLDPFTIGERFFTWSVDRWIKDTGADDLNTYESMLSDVSIKLENALRILEDDKIRRNIPNVRVLSNPSISQINLYLREMEQYVDLIVSTGVRGITSFAGHEPTWPLSGKPDILNIRLFNTVNPGPQATVVSLPWKPNFRFEGGSLVYGPNNEGLFIVPSDFLSAMHMNTDIVAKNLLAAVPGVQGLRLKPVAGVAEMAALVAADYAIVRTLDSGFEYVFHLGAKTGDIRDNNDTGYWVRTISSSPTGESASYNGKTLVKEKFIRIGVQPFTVTTMMVFVNGALRVDTEYKFDSGTGVITLDSPMRENDSWKVIVMS